MTTITITSTVCAGGGHVHVNWRLNSGQVREVVYDTDDLRGTPSREETEQALRTILRGHLMGLTRPQARTLLEAGITIAIEAT
jgi:hypothetical protein